MCSVPVVFLVSLEKVAVVLLRFVIQLEVFAATNFPSGLSNKCACCECADTIDDVLENLFLDFVSRS